MGKKKIVLDNVIISAFGWNGKPRKIFEKILEGNFELLPSLNQLEEIFRAY